MRLLRVVWYILGLGLILGAGGCNRSDPEAVALLRKAQQADETVYAQGKVAVNINRPDQEIQATAAVTRAPGTTIMQFQSGPEAGEKIVREGDRFYRVTRQGETVAAPRWGLDTVPQVEVLEKRYNLRVGDTETIAGQPATHVIVSPRWPQRGPTVNLWIDRNTGVVLARTREAENGNVLVSTRWTELKYTQPTEPTKSPQVATRPDTGNPPVRGAGRPGQGPGAKPRPGAWPQPEGNWGRRPPGGWGHPSGGQATGPAWHRPGAPGGRADTGEGGVRSPDGHAPGGGSGATRLASAEELGQSMGLPVSKPMFVPEGYGLTAAIAGPQRKYGVLQYSDGVHYFGVTVTRRAQTHKVPVGAEGAGRAVIVRWPRRTFAMAARGEVLYMLSGQLPEDVLLRVAASIP